MNNIYLLDITTLITFISDLCNDPNISSRFGSVEEWKNKNISIYNHIIDELKDPVLPKLKDKIKDGKILTTKSAWDKFNEIILLYGSKNEINEMNKLNIEIINDDLFDDFKNLNGRLWSEENKSVFGTSYKHNYIIVTGNIAVLNFLLNQGYEINYIAHRSRCFVSKRYEEKI